MKPAAVILAAGLSSRMPDFKPLMVLGGRSLVAHGAGLFQDAGITEIIIVTGHRHAARLARSAHTPAAESSEPPAKLKRRCARRDANNLRADAANTA